MRSASLAVFLAALCLSWTVASAQKVTIVRNVSLRPDPSSEYKPIRRLTPQEPPLTLLDPALESGYYHVKTTAQEEGYVWGLYVKVTITPADSSTAIQLGPGVDGSAGMVGCGDGLWNHVYHPTRLIVLQNCVTITGQIVDATKPPAHHQADGVRHEADGDTHGWLKVDPQFANLINAGDSSNEGGNLVFEIVCHYTVTQPDAKSACSSYSDHVTIPPIGTHVAITGTLVREKNHQHWNEIHPVSRIVQQP